MVSLIETKKGSYHSIKGISPLAPLKIKRRLLELGFTQNVMTRVLRKSLIGQAYLIEVRGFILSMRKDIANFILVEK